MRILICLAGLIFGMISTLMAGQGVTEWLRPIHGSEVAMIIGFVVMLMIVASWGAFWVAALPPKDKY